MYSNKSKSTPSYQIGIYICPNLAGLMSGKEISVRSKLQKLIRRYRGDEFWPDINILYFWLQDPKYCDATDKWVTLGRACNSLGIKFFIALAGSGHMVHLISPKVIEAISNDLHANSAFEGVYLSEPVGPSLDPIFPEKYLYWFDETRLLVPMGIFDKDMFNRAGLKQDSANYYHSVDIATLREAELHPANGAILDTHSPINNPGQMMRLWQQICKMWFKPYIKYLRKNQSIGYINHSPNQFLNCVGQIATKFVSGCGFNRWHLVSEINTGSYSMGYAELRGLVTANGKGMWGAMVGGVAWKYWQIDQYVKGKPSVELKDAQDYSRSKHLSEWYFRLPMTVAWANGGEVFVYEATPEQMCKVKAIHDGIGSFYQLLSDHPRPVKPRRYVGFLKGRSFWAGDLPGYQDGFFEEMTTRGFKYCEDPNRTEIRTSRGAIFNAFYPGCDRGHRWVEGMFSGNPHGEIDFLPPNTTLKILQKYRMIIMYDFNLLDKTHYEMLSKYVRSGGMLVLCAGHLLADSEQRINWRKPVKGEFFAQGNLLELAGVCFKGGAKTIKNAKIVLSPSMWSDGTKVICNKIELYEIEKIS